MSKVRLIDANAVRKKAVPHTRGNFGYSADIRKWAVLVADIDDAPTIDAVPVVHAKWVKRGNKYQCTNCKVLMDIDGTPEENLLYYCNHCGAKMDLE